MHSIVVLKDTPFHKKDDKLALIDFRACYGWMFTSSTSNDEIVKYFKNKEGLRIHPKEYQKDIHSWFDVVENFEEEPLVFVHEDLWYVKDFDGMYSVFINPMMYKTYIEHKRTQSACIKKIHIQEARNLIREAKFKKNILYCTNDVNKKL